jgi:hypothetical protein
LAYFGQHFGQDAIIRYETALKAHKFLLIAHGILAEVEQAKAILL